MTNKRKTQPAAFEMYGMPRQALAHVLPNMSMPPEAAAIYNAVREPSGPANDDKVDPKDCSDDDLQRDLRTVETTMDRIRADAAKENRELNQREQSRIEQYQEVAATLEAELNARHPAQRRTEPDPIRNAADTRNPAQPSPQAAARHGVLLPENRANIGSVIFGSQRGDWQNTSEFFSAVRNGLPDPRLFANAIGSEGVGTDGGFIVPPEFYRGVIEQALQQSEYAVRCRVFPSPSNSIFIPMPDIQNRTTGIAGLNSQWTAESQSRTAHKMKFRAVEMKLKKLMLLAGASNELLEDGVGFEAQLRQAMSQDAAYKLDAAIVAGSGVGQPLGFLGHPSVIGVNPESGQAADSVIYQNLAAMFGRLAPECRKRATWFISPGVLTQLLFMTFPGNATQPVLLSGGQNDAAAGAPAGTIFGRPVVVTEIAPALGDDGDVVLADMTQYALLLKATAQIEYSPHVMFESDDSVWRLRLRVDGQPMWDEPITPPNVGEPSLSWAVYLTARD